MPGSRLILLAAILSALASPGFAAIAPALALGLTATPPAEILPPPVVSMGQPHLIQLHWSPLAGYNWDAEQRVSRLTITVGGEPRIPQFGLMQTSFAGFAGERGGDLDCGLTA